jgi:hypothetical protein
MPNVFGREVTSVEEIAEALHAHGDAVRGTYRARYSWGGDGQPFYTAAALERPPALRENPRDVVFPWEHIYLSAATCAGSDYPMLAAHFGIRIDRVEFEVSGVFDPRGEFDGLAGVVAPNDALACFVSLHLKAIVDSSAPRDVLERIHERVIGRNMVLGALRGIPRTHELVVRAVRESAA